MRSASGWGDACILNISSRGLMIYAQHPVEPGSYIELRRGGALVVARVVWRKNQRVGLCSHDRLPVDDIISGAAAAAVVPSLGAPRLDRRRKPRLEDGSRLRGRAIQFLSLVLIASALASGLGFYVIETLGRPAAAVERALGSR